ncbi:hypothetical protein MF271_05510 [Deinococcus sp. KNUC1210]|uniref:hypothetical protein n=1 Tax=Deinococcus sp. KNUC1210 TaxID=2917691 RepID=UPI001EEFD97C|nr:hypothetical protein [Deinococcus sp. KNUC1210]ULH16089.1 hypothetical protein MF271_05510 [Deinococcus sp. KNUC1210]
MYSLLEAQSLPERLVGAETRLLGVYASRVPTAFVVPPTFEEGFYRHNNLPSQLSRMFAALRPQRIDEDLLETLCGQAQALVKGCALLDDSIQQFSRALHHAGLDSGSVHVRRPGARYTEYALARPPEPKCCSRSSGYGRTTGALRRSWRGSMTRAAWAWKLRRCW